MKSEFKILVVIVCLAFILRFYNLGSHIPLYSDEASLGYNAYSILKTGFDEDKKFLPVSLRSFGDYKPALSSYLMIPFIAFFGLNEWSVRLPSAILGTLSVVLVYFLTKKIFKKSHFALQYPASHFPLLTSILLAISPWHIQQSRLAMLVIVENFLILAGLLLFLTKSLKLRLLSFICFGLTIYSYYGSRLIIPLLILGLLIFEMRNKSLKLKNWLIGLFIFTLTILPFVSAVITNRQVFWGRVSSVSIFNHPRIEQKLWSQTTMDSDFNPLLTRFFHNKPTAYFSDFVSRYWHHFSGRFLFLFGDKAEPFQVPFMGVMYLIELPFLLLGFFSLLKDKPSNWAIVFWWLLISPITAALTAFTPASNRAFNMVIPLQIMTAYGLLKFFSWFKKQKILSAIVIFIYFSNFVYYLWQYYHVLPQVLAPNYLYGNKQAVEYIKSVEGDYDKIIATNMGGSYIYFLFYKKYPPQEFWQTRTLNSVVDEFGYEYVDKFGKYEFRRQFNWTDEEKRQKVLYVVRDEEVPAGVSIGFNTKKIIYYPNDQIAYKIIDL